MINHAVEQLPVSLAGRFLYHVIPYRRRVVMDNIDQVFGQKISPRDKIHLAKAYYSHLATCIKEGFLMRFMSEQALKDKVDVKGVEHLLNVAEQKNGVLVLTGHFGNWEFAPIGGIMNFKAYQGQFHFIRRTLKSKTIENILFRRYFKAGLKVIPKKNSLPQVVEALSQNHAVVFVMDQHASLANRDGVAVDFFGKKAGTYRSLATIARYTKVPVVPAASYRMANGRHVLEFHPPIEFEERTGTQDDLIHNTRKYNEALEALVLAHPEQWMWLHKRWKLKDTDTP